MDKTDITIKKNNSISQKIKIKNISYDNNNYWKTDYDLEDILYKENKFFGNFDFNLFKITSKFLFYKSKKNNDYEEKIFYNKIILNNKENIIGNIILVHGWFNSKKLWNLALNLALNGFIIHLFDLRGFGNSTGRSYNENFESFYEDLSLVIKECDIEMPLFLIGHSLGSLIVWNFSLINPQLNISGIICLSCLFTPPINRKFVFIKSMIIKYIGYLFEDFIMNSNWDWTSICKNNYFLKKLFLDDSISYHIGIRFIRSFLSHSNFLKNNIQKLKVPTLFITGKKDPLIDMNNLKNIVKKVNKKLITFKIFKNCFHEIYLEDEKFKINFLMLKWMNLILKYKKYNKVLNTSFLNTKRNKIRRKINIVIFIIFYISFSLILNKYKIYTNKFLLLFNPIKFMFNIMRVTNKLFINNIKYYLNLIKFEINN